MRKIKLSELPLCQSLKGLFTLGTDNENRSVKVSLEFISLSTDAAAAAATAANTAAQKAQTATTEANTAATNARTATTNANTATANANAAKTAANNAAATANSAASAAMLAKDSAEVATDNAIQATKEAQEATQAALLASKPIPLTLSVKAPARITFGNTAPNVIEATLTPESAMHNIIFISDNKAVSIDPKGRIRVLEKGVSEVHIIPTGNTALAKTVLIRVEDATLRLVTRNRLRITGSGKLRLN